MQCSIFLDKFCLSWKMIPHIAENYFWNPDMEFSTVKNWSSINVSTHYTEFVVTYSVTSTSLIKLTKNSHWSYDLHLVNRRNVAKHNILPGKNDNMKRQERHILKYIHCCTTNIFLISKITVEYLLNLLGCKQCRIFFFDIILSWMIYCLKCFWNPDIEFLLPRIGAA